MAISSTDPKLKIIKTKLEDLKNISPKNLAKLAEENITSLMDLTELSTVELKTLLNTTENKSSLILAEARKSLPPFKVYTGQDLMSLTKSQRYISTHCNSIDNLLGGQGFKTGTVSEVYGAFAAGKTQLSLTLVLSAMLPEPYGLNGSVVFIDTEDTFSIERLLSMAQVYSNIITKEEVLMNLRVIKPTKALDQMQVLKKFLENDSCGAAAYMKLEKPVILLVVDSLTAHFRAEYLGRGTLSERQQKLNEHLKDITQFARQTNCCGILINQVMANPDPFSVLEKELPIGGNVLSHATYCRIWLRKRKLFRLAVLVDSACLPAGEALFKIGSRGILDIDENEENVNKLKYSIQEDDVSTLKDISQGEYNQQSESESIEL